MITNFISLTLAFFGHRSWNLRKFLGSTFEMPVPFTERDRRKLTAYQGYVRPIMDRLAEIQRSITDNNKSRDGRTITRGATGKDKVGILFAAIGILIFITAAVATQTIYIQANSLDGSVIAALGLCVSFWSFSAASKYFVHGPLAPWRTVIDIGIAIIATLAFFFGIYELTDKFMSNPLESDYSGGPNFGSFGATTTVEATAGSAEPTSYQRLYYCLTILEISAVYTLINFIGYFLRPKRTEHEKAVDAENKTLRREERALVRRANFLNAEIAVLSERKNRQESASELLGNLLKKLGQ